MPLRAYELLNEKPPLASPKQPLIAIMAATLRIPGQGDRDSEVIPVSIPKLIRSRFRDEAGRGFRF